MSFKSLLCDIQQLHCKITQRVYFTITSSRHRLFIIEHQQRFFYTSVAATGNVLSTVHLRRLVCKSSVILKQHYVVRVRVADRWGSKQF